MVTQNVSGFKKTRRLKWLTALNWEMKKGEWDLVLFQETRSRTKTMRANWRSTDSVYGG